MNDPVAQQAGIGHSISRSWILRKATIIALLCFVGLIGNPFYVSWADRSIIVAAETGALDIVLTDELSGKVFENAYVCRLHDKPDIRLSDAPLGCSASRFELVQEVSFTPTLPPGTRLKLTGQPGRFHLHIVSIPNETEASDTQEPADRDVKPDQNGAGENGTSDEDRSVASEDPISVEDTPGNPRYSDAKSLVGGGVTLDAGGLAAFGQLTAIGHVTLGAAGAHTGDVPLLSASYQVNARPFLALVWPNADAQVIREGEVRSGAVLTFNRAPRIFVGEVEAQPEARLTVSIPDPETGLMRVMALSDFTEVELKVAYPRADPDTIRPSVVDAMASDPVLILLVTLIGGGAALLELLGSRRQ